MAPSYRHVILESQHVAIETHGGAGGAIQKPSENLSECGTAPYHRFFLVRDEGAIGPNPPRAPASCCDGETERNRANGADRAPGTTIVAAGSSALSQSQTPVATYVRSIGLRVIFCTCFAISSRATRGSPSHSASKLRSRCSIKRRASRLARARMQLEASPDSYGSTVAILAQGPKKSC